MSEVASGIRADVKGGILPPGNCWAKSYPGNLQRARFCVKLFRRAGSLGSTACQEARRYTRRDHSYPLHFKGCQGVQPATATLHKYFVRFVASAGFYW